MRNNTGQAILEYVVVLAIVIGISAILQYGVSKTRNKIWKWMICQVSAACAECNPTESAKKTLPAAGPCKK